MATYTMLTDLEAVFRNLTSELGLRPIYHRKTDRVNGHSSSHCSPITWCKPCVSNSNRKASTTAGKTIRAKMENQQRITVVMQRADGKTIHLRKTTKAEPHQKEIFTALGIAAQPGVTQKTIV